MYRAFPFAIRIAAFDTAFSLVGGLLLLVVPVNFAKFIDADKCWGFTGVGTLYFQKLEYV